MAETQTPLKRLREEKPECGSELDGSKRQKPYTNIINLLDEDEDEDEATQDLSDIFTTFQQELSHLPSAAAAPEEEAETGGGEDEDEGLKLSVMRHLLEASDDELGIPNRSTDEIESGILKSGENFSLGFNDWEFEDEAANYYAVLQSELFM